MTGYEPMIARRRFLASTVAGTIATMVPAPGTHTLAAERPTPAEPAQARTDTAIRPFHYRASDEELLDLKRRIRATKWPEKFLEIGRAHV